MSSKKGTTETTQKQELDPLARAAMDFIMPRAMDIYNKQDPSGMNDQMRNSLRDLTNYFGSDAYRQPNQQMANVGLGLMNAPMGNPFANGQRSLNSGMGGGMGGLMGASRRRGGLMSPQPPQPPQQPPQMPPQAPQGYGLQPLTQTPPPQPAQPQAQPSPVPGMTLEQYKALKAQHDLEMYNAQQYPTGYSQG